MSTHKQSQGDLSLAQQAYLEVIGELEQGHGHAHVSELARTLDVSKPSVVQMLARLVEIGVARKQEKEIVLTAVGRRIVRELGDRQTLLQELMISHLAMDQKTAARESCRLEHVVSPVFMRHLRGFLSKAER